MVNMTAALHSGAALIQPERKTPNLLIQQLNCLPEFTAVHSR